MLLNLITSNRNIYPGKWKIQAFYTSKMWQPALCKHFHHCFRHLWTLSPPFPGLCIWPGVFDTFPCICLAFNMWSTCSPLIMPVYPVIRKFIFYAFYVFRKFILLKSQPYLIAFLTESLTCQHFCPVPDNPALSERLHRVSSFPLLCSRTLWKNNMD